MSVIEDGEILGEVQDSSNLQIFAPEIIDDLIDDLSSTDLIDDLSSTDLIDDLSSTDLAEDLSSTDLIDDLSSTDLIDEILIDLDKNGTAQNNGTLVAGDWYKVRTAI